jgi:outer membrane receptor protein involved in Fe transport
MKFSARVLLGGILLACTVLPALALTGGLKVMVLDAENRTPLPGATVTLSNTQALIAPTSQISDAKGLSEFPVLRAGDNYRLEVSFGGFSPQQHADISINSNQTVELEFYLNRPYEETIRVSAGTPLVSLDQVGSSTKFSEEFIEDIPAPGRFYQDLLTMAPGISDEDGDGNPNVFGARSRNYRVEVGGISNVDPLTGQWLSRVNPDSIQELEMISVGAGAEFGRAQGGFGRIIQKQGSNDFEGVFNFLYRSSVFDGDGAADLPPELTPDFETLQPSLSISGPVIKDKLWFRLSHDYITREDPVNILNQVAILTRDQRISSDQLTWQVSARNKLMFQYQNDPLVLDNQGISSAIPPEASRTFKAGGPTYSINWVAPFSARVLLDTTVAWQDREHQLIPTTNGVEMNCLTFFYITSLHQAQCENETTGLTSGSHYDTSRDHRQRLTLKSQATLYRRLWNQSHQFKFGLQVENERYFRELDRGPEMTYFEKQQGFSVIGISSTRVSLPRDTRATATGTNWSMFAEDQWKPVNNLSVTFGLRFDREEISAKGFEPIDPIQEADRFSELLAQGLPLFSIPAQSFTGYEDISGFRQSLVNTLEVPDSWVNFQSTIAQSGFWNSIRRQEDIFLHLSNLSPRFSLSWDPWRDGKTKLSLSAGRYFDKIFLAVPLTEQEPTQTTLTYEAQPPGFINYSRSIQASSLSARMVDRNLTTPFQDEFTLSIERELFAESVLKLMYINRNFKDQLQDVDINHVPGGDFGRCLIASQLGDPVIVASLDEPDILLTDPYTGETYFDTTPGPGDGFEDDCTGEVAVVPTGAITSKLVPIPDGKPDLYVQNPGWRELLIVGNFNTTSYEAVVLEFVRRQYRNWQMEASYTWSKAEGNAEDFDLTLGNELNLVDDERGFLSYDQTHVVKVNAIAHLPWGLRLGTHVRWESGFPYSIRDSLLTLFSGRPEYQAIGDRGLRLRIRYPTGQRNDQRNDAFWTVDMRVAKDFRLPGDVMLQLSIEAFNLLNDDTLRTINITSGISDGERRFGREWQLGVKMHF